MTTETKRLDARRARRYAAIAGIALAVACHLVPAEYRAACDVIASICTGGISP